MGFFPSWDPFQPIREAAAGFMKFRTRFMINRVFVPVTTGLLAVSMLIPDGSTRIALRVIRPLKKGSDPLRASSFHVFLDAIQRVRPLFQRAVIAGVPLVAMGLFGAYKGLQIQSSGVIPMRCPFCDGEGIAGCGGSGGSDGGFDARHVGLSLHRACSV